MSKLLQSIDFKYIIPEAVKGGTIVITLLNFSRRTELLASLLKEIATEYKVDPHFVFTAHQVRVGKGQIHIGMTDDPKHYGIEGDYYVHYY